MTDVGRLVPVLPVPLVSSVLLDAGAPLSESELKARAHALADRLVATGAHLYVPRSDLDYAISAGLRMLVLRHLVIVADGLHSRNPSETALLAYYANSLAHLRQQVGYVAPRTLTVSA